MHRKIEANVQFFLFSAFHPYKSTRLLKSYLRLTDLASIFLSDVFSETLLRPQGEEMPYLIPSLVRS